MSFITKRYTDNVKKSDKFVNYVSIYFNDFIWDDFIWDDFLRDDFIWDYFLWDAFV